MGPGEDFIDDIYEASLIPEMWPPLLEKLAGMTDALGAGLFTVSGTTAPWVASPELVPLMQAFMEGRWVEINTRAPRAAAIAHPGFITDLDAFSMEEIDRDPFYQDFLIPSGIGWSTGTHIALPTGDVVSITIERRYERGPVERHYVDLLDGLRPHLARAAMLSARLALERARTAAITLESVGLPAAVLGARGQLLAGNRLIEPMIPSVLQDGSARLRFTDPRADPLLQAGVEALAGRFGKRTFPQSFPIAGADGRPTSVAHLLPVKGQARDVFGGMQSVLVIMPLSGTAVAPASLVQALFDFTPAEARVALALGEGASVDDAAQRLGVSRETVRSHLRAIFSKTGVSRQSALVRLLAGLSPPGGLQRGRETKASGARA